MKGRENAIDTVLQVLGLTMVEWPIVKSICGLEKSSKYIKKHWLLSILGINCAAGLLSDVICAFLEEK